MLKTSLKLMLSLLICLIGNSAIAKKNTSTKIEDIASSPTYRYDISINQPNRIAIFGRKIVKVTHSKEGVLDLSADQKAGAIFLQLRAKSETFSMILTDDVGEVYHVSLRPIHTDSKIINIRSLNNDIEDHQKVPSQTAFQPLPVGGSDYEKNIVAMMTELRRYRYDELIPGEKQIGEKLLINFVRTVSNNQLKGEIYQIVNLTKAPLTINEEDFYREGVISISVDKLSINAGDFTTLYVLKAQE
jgi:conjugal transfer pilus assembly protein TraK